MSESLTDKQRLAIPLLCQGLSDADVAAKVGVSRETVCRWRGGNDAFKVALNAARAEVWQEAHDRLRALVSDAVTVLEGSVKGAEADHRVAVAILKTVGIYGSVGKPDGAVTLKQLEQERRQAEFLEVLTSV